MKNIKELDKKYIANTYARFPVEIVTGKGALLYDEFSKEYIDLGGGIAVNIFGVQDKSWKKAIIEQLNKCQHTSNLYYSAPCVELAEVLVSRTRLRKVFFSNSGAEANECAIKVMRKYSEDKKGPGHHNIVTLKNSFHGRTLATIAATGQEEFHKDFLPVTEGFITIEAGDIDSFKATIENNKCAGVLIEIVQGEGGVIPLDEKYVKELSRLTKERDLILAIDEVQTGNGRTGALYSYMHYDILPDIVTTAKGIGGGLPIGVTILGEKVENVLIAGTHGSTFGGNPVCAAGAVNILSRIDDALLESVTKKSKYIFRSLSKSKGVKNISGLGLMIGIETYRPAQEVIEDCIKEGVLVLKAKNKVRLLPPLNIPMTQLKKAIAVLIEVCERES